MDHHVTILTDDERRGVITLGDDIKFYKVGNICFDFKQALCATLEYVASLSIPDSRIKAIQMLVLTAFWIAKAVRVEIKGPAADILCHMSEKGLFGTKIEEEFLIEEFQKWYKERHGAVPTRADVFAGIQTLADCRCITIEEGMISLCEKVWGKR